MAQTKKINKNYKQKDVEEKDDSDDDYQYPNDDVDSDLTEIFANIGQLNRHKSGQIIEVAKVPNLAIVDIDLHRTQSDMQKDDTQNKILWELGGYKKSLGLVHTAHGGLYYHIDIFAAIDQSFRGVVQAGPTIREYIIQKKLTLKYIDLNDYKSQTFFMSIEVCS
ncbi:MAG: hypothetical protein EZS28_026456 [Streblomastix strix]|uniref:Uncharacterized protein n=1 Tax=Streblomastix strix TaxID=222440 RepID=A0A5J4V517_9EUKA|nr:MAG: hypothetical protein EZS28_026456 [Streblomastix strix]